MHEQKFEVVCKIEVRATTPERAAMVARDMMMDPDTQLHVDVLPFEYVKEADEWFPTSERGWSIWFGELRYMWHSVDDTRFPRSAVHPSECIEWTRTRHR